MNREELKQYFTDHHSSFTMDDSGEHLSVTIPEPEFYEWMKMAASAPELKFDFLTFMTCIDWKDHFMMVYHLFSRDQKHELVVKVKLENRDQAEIDSVWEIWRTAEFHEREVFDLFGVKFHNHPDLRRLFLDDTWEGYPLRKDYTDENMIEL